MAHYYTERYHRAMDALNVETPSIEPYASGHIIEQIEFVKRILADGYAYEANGSVYFDVEKYNAKLLILDPMSSYIGDTCSMNNANETRAEFNHLIAVAKDTGCAIVIIAHMNKAKDTSPLYRTNGSIDIAGAARSILAVTRTANKQNPAERYLVQVKSNLAPMGSAILFEVADKGVNFLDELELSAEDAFSASAPRMGRPNDREEAATDFIRSLLSGGRRLASDCEAKLEAAGFKKSTYKKSKKKAGVRSVKDGFLWYWTLPEVEKPIENGQEVTDEDDLPI